MSLIGNISNTIKAGDKSKKLDNRKKRQHKKAKKARRHGDKEKAQMYSKKASVSAHTSRRVGGRAIQQGVQTGFQAVKFAADMAEENYAGAALTFVE